MGNSKERSRRLHNCIYHKKHFKKRMKERFGVVISNSQIEKINKLIQEKKSKIIEEQEDKDCHIVFFNDRLFVVVYHKADKYVSTVLPLEDHRYNELKRIKEYKQFLCPVSSAEEQSPSKR